MPAKEIKELRQSGKLDEALQMAKAELEMSPDNIWCKRNISWVYYEYLKSTCLPEHFEQFMTWLKAIQLLQLPAEEKMLFDNVCWQIGKMAFSLLKTVPLNTEKPIQLIAIIKGFHFTQPSEAYSFLFKSLHKNLKDSDSYLEFADWWGFRNFRAEDFQKEKLENKNEIMAIAEQAYIAYTKQLLPRYSDYGAMSFNREKALAFLPELSNIVEQYPQFQYPAYFKAKLLLALGDKDNMLGALLPFAKKKRNDFWVWEILAEAFFAQQDLVFACYCKALSCKSPEEMLVNLRQKMARLLIERKLLKEAKTEIELLIRSRNSQGYKIPNEVSNWQSLPWYETIKENSTNFHFYKGYLSQAESLLYSDIQEETVIVEYVNATKHVLNFIASEKKYGFFNYDRFFREVNVGDVLKVRFQNGTTGGLHQLYTANKIQDDWFKSLYLKEVTGIVRIPTGKNFGFLDNVFIHPSIVTAKKLTDGLQLSGSAIKSFNAEKKQWGWRFI
jgi:hypothetical protein